MESESGELSIMLKNAVEIATAVLEIPAGSPADLPVEISFQLNNEGRLYITAIEKKKLQSVDVSIDTSSVINGDDLEAAKKRCQALIVH